MWLKQTALAGAALACGLGVVAPASALSITPASTPVYVSSSTSALTAAQIATLVGYGGTLALAYKQDYQIDPMTSMLIPEEGNAAMYYSTSFSPAGDPDSATITWDGPTYGIACPSCYLVVKDGQVGNPKQYVFDIGSWNGAETINLSGFWPQQGAISFVAIYNAYSMEDGGGSIASIPEPETYAMLLAGLGLVGFAARRKLS